MPGVPFNTVLLGFSSSHRNASFDLLEQLERSASPIESALLAAPGVTGAVVLATCNRFEAYLDVDDGADSATLLERVADAAHVESADLAQHAAVIAHDAVPQHLFAVSSGLESVVVGEGEIAGQVRRALAKARQAGTTTRGLERLFDDASRASRQVKNTTGLTTAGRSMVHLALELSQGHIADWASAKVVLVGTGQYAAVSLAAVRAHGAADIAVFSRTQRGAQFALKHDVAHVDDLAAALHDADLVIACTVAPGLVIGVDAAREAIAGRTRPLLVIDLGLPRNVDAAVDELAGVTLLDLATISLHAPLDELQATDDARGIVGDAATEFAAKAAERDVEPALVALRERILSLVDAEVERHRHRESAADIERALRHFAGVLLHDPSVLARELARAGRADDFVDGLRAVFGVTPPEGPASADRGAGGEESGAAEAVS